MVRVHYTPQLRRFTETPEVDSAALTLLGALEDAFVCNLRLRGYVLDDQGHVRPNVVIRIDGRRSSDRIELAETLAPTAACTCCRRCRADDTAAAAAVHEEPNRVHHRPRLGRHKQGPVGTAPPRRPVARAHFFPGRARDHAAAARRAGPHAGGAEPGGTAANFMPPEMAHDPNIRDAHRIQRRGARPEVLWCQHHGGIWRRTDNAASWHELQTPVSSLGFAVAAHPHDAYTAWFVPAVKDEKRVPVDGAMAVNRTRDGGKTFETLRAGLPQRHAYDLVYRHGLDVAADGTSLMVGSTTGNLWASADAGDSWQTVSLHLPPIAAVRFGCSQQPKARLTGAATVRPCLPPPETPA